MENIINLNTFNINYITPENSKFTEHKRCYKSCAK